MDYSTAEMICILKVDTQCESCKAKVIKVLQKIRGVYNITIDGEQGTVKVTGRVNPSELLYVLDKYGKHADMKYIKFDGEVVERRTHNYGEYGHGPYGMEPSYPPPLPCCQQYHSFYPPPLPPPPPPPYLVAPPPPPPPAPFWAPPPPGPFGPPPLSYLLRPPPPASNGKTSSQNKKGKRCIMM